MEPALNFDIIAEISNRLSDNYPFMCAYLGLFHKCKDFTSFAKYALKNGETRAVLYYLKNWTVDAEPLGAVFGDYGFTDGLRVLFAQYGEHSIMCYAAITAAEAGQTQCLQYILDETNVADIEVFSNGTMCSSSEISRAYWPLYSPLREMSGIHAAEERQVECVDVCGVYTAKMVESAYKSGCDSTFAHVFKHMLLTRPHDFNNIRCYLSLYVIASDVKYLKMYVEIIGKLPTVTRYPVLKSAKVKTDMTFLSSAAHMFLIHDAIRQSAKYSKTSMGHLRQFPKNSLGDVIKCGNLEGMAYLLSTGHEFSTDDFIFDYTTPRMIDCFRLFLATKSPDDVQKIAKLCASTSALTEYVNACVVFDSFRR
ncbi:MAG: hypothetical protein MUO31_07735 [Thermodesulfovibrionales bacterium]|nr:hypothetical protein [Thermodesulfovibrionales bacterium]